MKSYKSCLAAILALVSAESCTKSAEPGTQDGGSVPAVESVSITDGAEKVAVDIGYIDILYDIPVSIADESAISLSDTETTVSATNLRVRISFDRLNGETEYILDVKNGAVVSRNGNVPAEGFTVSFTTAEDTEIPPYTPEEPGEYTETLAMDNPLPNAERLYQYLLSIYGKNILSGAMAKVAWNTDEAEWIGKCTGKYPAMAFFDYIHLASSPANWINYGDIAPVLDWWNEGGLVGAGWHWSVPVSEGSSQMSFNAEGNGFSAAAAVTSGTWENGVVNADLDKIASYLLMLQEEGIPVIWRPLHEAAGNTYTYGTGAWFWWGADGAQAYRNLWIYIFEYLEQKGVRNLIWVWTTQTSSQSDADYAFYPGDEYVDIVGRDIYNLAGAEHFASQFETITHMVPHKMAALSELGNVDDIASQWDAGAHWLFFMPWYDNGNDFSSGYAHEHADIQWWNRSFGSDAVLDRSKLPSDLFE